MSERIRAGDWFQTPGGLILVEKVMKSALVCILHTASTITQVIRMDDEAQGWLLIGRRDSKVEVTRWCDPAPLPGRTSLAR